MPISKFFSKTAAKLLEGIFNASGADIRIHNRDNIPDQSALYVINHFTRIETTFLPYILYKHTGKLALSLADHSFFGGTFGKIMEKLGGVSTKDPERNKILIRALLKGDMSVIIFPEGQMLKDKKLIEKGKYMVYNTGIRRPPHTGAARLALQTQFYREKIRLLHENNKTEDITELLKFFDLKKEDLNDILKNSTIIIPANVTYFPIRAKNNAINKLAGKFLKKIPERLEEELQVEGTMLVEGVSIDINFGKPILVKDYINKSKNAVKMISASRLFTDFKELNSALPLRKISVDLMHKYMDSIYEMTTINHDHIFSYILIMSPRNKIRETVFKNKVFLAIEEIKKRKPLYCNPLMMKNQFHMLTDDEYKIYDSFIDAAKSDQLIEIKDGYIIKNKKRFNKQYKFHTIRKDNIVEVIKNEIEPLKGILKTMRKIMLRPPFLDRRRIRKMFIELDNNMFKQDYKKYAIPEESKPMNIGRPFMLKRSKKRGVILIHGYLAAPEEIRILADFLAGNGYTVYGARLRGHGTSPEDLAKREWIDWYHSVNRAYIIMENSVKEFAIIGFSTGAGLALLQASNKGNKFKCVVSINAPLHLQNITSHFTSAVAAWNKLLKKINLEKGKFEYVTNTPENPHINYFRNPLSGVNELGKLMNIVEDNLNKIEIPALIIQGSNDPVVNPVSGPEIFDKIGTEEKELHRIYSNRHGIVRGDEAEKVSQVILNFLNNRFF